MKFGLIFAMGSDMGELYCTFEEESIESAEKLAAKCYPGRWTHTLPWDSRFEAHVKVYEKEEIPLGYFKALRGPDEPTVG